MRNPQPLRPFADALDRRDIRAFDANVTKGARTKRYDAKKSSVWSLRSLSFQKERVNTSLRWAKRFNSGVMLRPAALSSLRVEG
jgi:hypothetical protein